MTTTRQCWFCEREATAETMEFLVNQDGERTTVGVPRCAHCADAHRRAFRAFLTAFAVVTVLGIAVGIAAVVADGASGPGSVIGAGIGLLGALPGAAAGIWSYRRVLRRAGTRPHRDGLRHPAVAEAVDAG